MPKVMQCVSSNGNCHLFTFQSEKSGGNLKFHMPGRSQGGGCHWLGMYKFICNS
jgi:hypothetical protein